MITIKQHGQHTDNACICPQMLNPVHYNTEKSKAQAAEFMDLQSIPKKCKIAEYTGINSRRGSLLKSIALCMEI